MTWGLVIASLLAYGVITIAIGSKRGNPRTTARALRRLGIASVVLLTTLGDSFAMTWL
jgi:hypothetical protein